MEFESLSKDEKHESISISTFVGVQQNCPSDLTDLFVHLILLYSSAIH